MSEPRIHGHAHLWLCTSTMPCELGAPHVCALPSVERLARWIAQSGWVRTWDAAIAEAESFRAALRDEPEAER